VTDERFILAIKINSADFSEGGFDADESREMSVRLEAAGVDLIELSGGTFAILHLFVVTWLTPAQLRVWALFPPEGEYAKKGGVLH
jgi:2,4-dienoyl-CoA reductase-like NADH-dependent reductase (Old Yellow Enzyme family)